MAGYSEVDKTETDLRSISWCNVFFAECFLFLYRELISSFPLHLLWQGKEIGALKYGVGEPHDKKP